MTALDFLQTENTQSCHFAKVCISSKSLFTVFTAADVLASRQCGVWCSVMSVCLFVHTLKENCLELSIKVGRHIVHGMTSACTDPEVKRSNPNLNRRVRVLSFAVRMGQDVEQRGTACQYDCTFL